MLFIFSCIVRCGEERFVLRFFTPLASVLRLLCKAIGRKFFLTKMAGNSSNLLQNLGIGNEVKEIISQG